MTSVGVLQFVETINKITAALENGYPVEDCCPREIAPAVKALLAFAAKKERRKCIGICRGRS